MKKPYQVFVSVYPFSRHDPKALRDLHHEAIEFKLNPHHRKLRPQELAELAENADIVIAGTEDLTPLIHCNKNLKLIARVGIGLDSVPLELCQKHNIRITYTPDAVTRAVAELTLGMMICGPRRVLEAHQQICSQQNWERFVGRGLSESVVGIIGFGRVGKRVANYLLPFAPKKILINDLKPPEPGTLPELIEFATKEKIYQEAHIISFHVPKTKLTFNMFNAEKMKLLRDDSFLINTSRGGIINETDLFDLLTKRKTIQASLDVFEQEPYQGVLTTLPNVVLTQHMGSCTYEARYLMETQAVQDVIHFVEGKNLQQEVLL